MKETDNYTKKLIIFFTVFVSLIAVISAVIVIIFSSSKSTKTTKKHKSTVEKSDDKDNSAVNADDINEKPAESKDPNGEKTGDKGFNLADFRPEDFIPVKMVVYEVDAGGPEIEFARYDSNLRVSYWFRGIALISDDIGYDNLVTASPSEILKNSEPFYDGEYEAEPSYCYFGYNDSGDISAVLDNQSGYREYSFYTDGSRYDPKSGILKHCTYDGNGGVNSYLIDYSGNCYEYTFNEPVTHATITRFETGNMLQDALFGINYSYVSYNNQNEKYRYVIEYDYDSNGNPIHLRKTYCKGDEPEKLIEECSYEYNESGWIIKAENLLSGSVTEYRYEEVDGDIYCTEDFDERAVRHIQYKRISDSLSDGFITKENEQLFDSFVDGKEPYITEDGTKIYITDNDYFEFMKDSDEDSDTFNYRNAVRLFIDADNDGEAEMWIMDSFYGGQILDIRGGELHEWVYGDGTALTLDMTMYQGNNWIVYCDISHANRAYFELHRYQGYNNIAESIDLRDDWDNSGNHTYTCNGNQISWEEFSQMYYRIFHREYNFGI